VWVLKHAADARLVPAAPAILAALLHLLDDGARPVVLECDGCRDHAWIDALA